MRLVLSHAAVLILGVLAGNFYWSMNRPVTESDLSMLARKPLSDAFHLAFRFGSRDHARILVEETRRRPLQSGDAAGDELFAQLYLAVLDREHEAQGSDSPHLQAASVACKRVKTRCEPSRMKEAAAKLSLLRAEPAMPAR